METLSLKIWGVMPVATTFIFDWDFGYESQWYSIAAENGSALSALFLSSLCTSLFLKNKFEYIDIISTEQFSTNNPRSM